jgi:hypothetical protein
VMFVGGFAIGCVEERCRAAREIALAKTARTVSPSSGRHTSTLASLRQALDDCKNLSGET